jgi:thiamine-phosphate pyrophosphorylase
MKNVIGKQASQFVKERFFGLYVIIDPNLTGGRNPIEIAKQTLAGGANIVQLRAKDHPDYFMLSLAQEIANICNDYGSLFIVNDRVDIAAISQAHGVHLGLDDLPVSDARTILKHDQIVGCSTHSLEEALAAKVNQPDYIAVGAMYPTTAKDQPLVGGTPLLRKIKSLINLPIVAIGGITQENVGPVVQAGADAICVISAVGLAADPQNATEKLKNRIRIAGGKTE